MCKEADDKLNRIIQLAMKTGHLHCAENVYDQLKVYEKSFALLNIKLDVNKMLPDNTILACNTNGLEVHTVERSSDTREVIGASPLQATDRMEWEEIYANRSAGRR